MDFFSGEAPQVNLDHFTGWILHEDKDLLVLDKPGWLVCHPSKNGPFSSLVGAAKEYLGVASVHLASRLDRETSGVVIMAKHRKAASHWQKGIEAKSVRRSYIAILQGHIADPVKVSGYIGKDNQSTVFVKQMMVPKSRKSKFSETVFIPLAQGGGFTICLVQTKTGRKHQIRVHASHMDFPLLGDKLYGPDEQIYLDFCTSGWNEHWRSTLFLPRQALHGRMVYDFTANIGFKANLPCELEEFIQRHILADGEALQQLIDKADSLFTTTTNLSI